MDLYWVLWDVTKTEIKSIDNRTALGGTVKRTLETTLTDSFGCLIYEMGWHIPDKERLTKHPANFCPRIR